MKILTINGTKTKLNFSLLYKPLGAQIQLSHRKTDELVLFLQLQFNQFHSIQKC